jgi:CheY-like chemotaxis protein
VGTALIVDDDEMSRSSVRTLLEALGHSATVVSRELERRLMGKATGQATSD